jgi:hypothetical protein
MNNDRQFLRESAAWLEAMREDDRERARAKYISAPASLTAYERDLLADDLWWRQQQAAAERCRAEVDQLRQDVTAALRPAGIVFRSALLERLNAHAIDVVVQHGIRVSRSPDGGGLAHQEERRITVPPATSEEWYAVVLHEVGHIVEPTADSRQYRAIVDTEKGWLLSPLGEVGAWTWAAQHALVWTVAMQDRLFLGLERHASSASDDERHAMAQCLTRACLRITGKTWTFGELNEKHGRLGVSVDVIRRATVHALAKAS